MPIFQRPQPKTPQTPQVMLARLLVETVACGGALVWLLAAPKSMTQVTQLVIAGAIGLALLAIGRLIANAVLARRRR